MSNDETRQAQGIDDRGAVPLPVPPLAEGKSIPTPTPDVKGPVEPEQPTPLGTVGQNDLEMRARFAEETHQYIREFIRLADQKATFLFTGATALLAFLYKNGISRRWLKPVMLWNILDMSGFVAMMALSLGALFSVWVIKPRLAGSRRGYLFWGAISEHSSAREYADDLSTLSAATLARVKAEHCFELAKVASSKYNILRIALWLCAAGLGASLIVFLFSISPT